MMIDEGKLGREKDGLQPTRHPVLCLDEQQQILDRVRAAATNDEPIDDQTATLLALAGPSQMLEVVAPDRADRKIAKRRIKEAAERSARRGGGEVRDRGCSGGCRDHRLRRSDRVELTSSIACGHETVRVAFMLAWPGIVQIRV